MSGNALRFLRYGAGLVTLAILGWVLTGQAAQPTLLGLPTDWTHHHVIFSRPSTAEQLRRVADDPRYWQQWFRRNVSRALPQSEDASAVFTGVENLLPVRFRKMHRDWSQSLGSGGTEGGGNFPAKYVFSINTSSCSDYVVFGTSVAGSSSQASIIAFDNLYKGGCTTGSVPSVNWAYNTGGLVKTSPVLSLNGSQIAFVQTDGFGHGSLVLLKWAASSTQTISSPGTPTSIATSSYSACTAPCMTTIALRDGSNVQTDDTTSSVFYIYGTDTAWVGDSRGWLHQFSPVFNGTPAEIRTSPWPLQVNAGNPIALSSPVFDRATSNIFVGDYAGFFYRVVTTGATAGTFKKSLQVDHGTGLVLGPIVDPTINRAYVFSSSDGSSSCNGSPCSAVYQFPTNFAANAAGVEVTVGTASLNPNPLYQGEFDSAYENSSGTGNLYVCGNTAGIPTLYQVPIKAGVMQTPTTGPTLASAATGCSPITDVSNPNATGGTTEWIYAAVQASGASTSCSGGCLMNFVDTPWLKSHNYSVGQEILDNHFQIQVVSAVTPPGTSRASAPIWNTTVGGNTADNLVTWLDQGPVSASIAAWKANTSYAVGNEVFDNHSPPNVQLCKRAGTSNATAPAWNAAVGGPTNEAGGPHWVNVGPLATFGITSAGGASGTIIDNVGGAGTVAGGSQVYFTTLTNQTTCGAVSTVGCAIQASQSQLQ